MKVENTIVQMRKGILEYCILLIISRGEVYASDLIEELKQAKIIVVEGTLYPLLNRLYKADLLTYTWKESTAGPPRKYYRLSENGKPFLEQMDRTWKNLLHSIEYISSKEVVENQEDTAPEEVVVIKNEE